MNRNSANWWDTLEKPRYGGELVIRANWNIMNFDPYFGDKTANINSAWMEKLHTDDWTVNPAVFDYKTCCRPSQYLKGQLAENWEFTEPGTIVFHLRKGIHWQDIPPANGREFIADDVVFHFNRLCGIGGGFTKPSPLRSAAFKDLISVNAPDRYTVVFKWKSPNTEFIIETLLGPDLALWLENPDAVKKWGDVSDWHHAIGTGSFILKDFVSGVSATLAKNNNYWGHDERYPRNKLPYLDTVKYLVLPDDTAALEAMRAGKIDIIDGLSFKQVQAMQKTNPELLQIFTPLPPTFSMDPRIDKAPFNDIRVRKATQMAIDLPEIARTYYQGTVEPYPDTLTSRYMKGWGFPYEEWPQDLKDEYAYNPAAARALLAEAGYPDGFKTNIAVEPSTDIDLLQIVKSYLARVGIDLEIRVIKSSEWGSFAKTGHKYDQMVHAPTGLLGHTAPPIDQLSRLQVGSYNNYGMIDDPVCTSFYTRALAANSQEEVLLVLREANEYIARKHFTISLLQPMTYSLCQPWVKGFNAQFGSTWGVVGGPLMLSFYLGRFWIDQKLKKEMSH
jgi:peptide/nickel transport system substrate-binding protein